MLARVEQTVDIGADGKPEGGGLGAQLVRGALGHCLVCRRHVLARGGVVRLGGAARMTGDPLALVEDRHRRCGQEDVEPSMHQPVRHGIEVAVDGDVVVDVDPRHEPLPAAGSPWPTTKGAAGNGLSLSRSIASNSERRLPSRGGANGRLFHSSIFSASAALASASEKNCRWRSGASTHISTSLTAFSADGLSRGFLTRAGTIATLLLRPRAR